MILMRQLVMSCLIWIYTACIGIYTGNLYGWQGLQGFFPLSFWSWISYLCIFGLFHYFKYGRVGLSQIHWKDGKQQWQI